MEQSEHLKDTQDTEQGQVCLELYSTSPVKHMFMFLFESKTYL